MANPDFMARVYLKLTWVKVTASDALILAALATRSKSLEVHTEVLQSRDDATQWILCDYYFVEPKEMPLGLCKKGLQQFSGWRGMKGMKHRFVVVQLCVLSLISWAL